MAIAADWEHRIGKQRDWVWRGWQTRFSFSHPPQPQAQLKSPLILLHGFGACIEHWRNNIPIIAEQYPVYALDLLGFGASRKISTHFSVNLWAEQVYDFWRVFIEEPVVLVGNSIGSLVCLAIAERYPEMVRGITLINLPDVSLRQEMIPQWLLPFIGRVERLVASPLLLKPLFYLLRRPSIIRRWAAVAYPDATAISPELVDILAIPAQDLGAAATFTRLCQAVNRPNFSPSARQALSRLSLPILLVWGTQDRMVPITLAPRFTEINPNLEFIPLKGAGHCPHDEHPERFNCVLLDWLADNFA